MFALIPLLALSAAGANALSTISCSVSSSENSSFPIVQNGVATQIIVSSDDWEGVHLAVNDFASDIERVTGVKPEVVLGNATLSNNAVIVGTVGKSSILSQVSGLNTTDIEGEWESFTAQVVDGPLAGVDQAYIIAGSDKRGTIYALYEHSEQFGVSPWYWCVIYNVSTRFFSV